MKSLNAVFLKRKTKWAGPYKENKLKRYLNRKLRRKKFKHKEGYYYPVREMKILWIAKATGLSYQQVRDRLDNYIRCGMIEKWLTATSYQKNGNYYRLIAPLPLK